MHDWSLRAICLEEDPELFFPIGDGLGAQRQVAFARQVCETCPVLDECLEFALATDAQYGVWAGTTPYQRRKMRRRAGAREALPRRVVRRSPAALSEPQTFAR